MSLTALDILNTLESLTQGFAVCQKFQLLESTGNSRQFLRLCLCHFALLNWDSVKAFLFIRSCYIEKSK